MEFVINGKERELRFGIGFIRKLDEVFTVEMHGVPFGMGLTMSSAQLAQYNPSALSEVIRCAVKGNVTLRDVDTAVEEYAEEHGGLGELFEQIIAELGKSPVAIDTMKKMELTTK